MRNAYHAYSPCFNLASFFAAFPEEGQAGEKDVKVEIKTEPMKLNVSRDNTPSTRSTRQSIGRAARREREESFSSGMSLDVLAQVATETLEKEPVSQKKPNVSFPNTKSNIYN